MKVFKRVAVFAIIVIMAFGFVGCVRTANEFEYWNECMALAVLKDYVRTATDKNSKDYVPVEDRVAVFDMDGTLCGELFPEYLEYMLLAYRGLDDPDYKDKASDFVKQVATEIKESGANYKTPAIENYDIRHGMAQAEAFAGLTPEEFMAYVKNFLDMDAQGFEGLKYKDSIYKPMIEVVAYLQKNDFTVYIVSGSDRMLCRVVACETLNIPENQVIGMDVNLVAKNQPEDKDNLHYQFNDNGEDVLVRSGELWLKNLKMNKVFNIAQEIGKKPVLSFGNSSGDISMHEYTLSGNKYKSKAFMLVADDTERDHADMAETNKRIDLWGQYDYTIISMKHDFKTIYGEGVKMVK